MDNVESELKYLGILYNGSDERPEDGLALYIASQKNWTGELLERFVRTSTEFVTIVIQCIWRPPETTKELKNQVKSIKYSDPERYERLVPLEKPKLHNFVAHVPDFIIMYGLWGAFSEESFEHFQGVSLRTRRRHSRNKPLGVQIVDDMYFLWFLCSPLAHRFRQEAKKV